MNRRAFLRLVSASALLAACEGGAPTSSKEPLSSKEPILKDPVPIVPNAPVPIRPEGSPMFVTDPDPRTPFLLDFIGRNLRRFGELRIEDGKTMTFYEAMEWTRLRSDVSGFIAPSTAPVDEDVTGFVPPVFENDALAIEVISPRDYDQRANEVIGLYSCRVEAHELDDLRRAIEGTPWAQLPQPTGSEHNDIFYDLRYSRGDLLIERTFSTGCYEFIEAIKPVWERLMNVKRKFQPLATLEIHATAKQASAGSKRYKLHVTLENRGTQPVVFTDPRLPFGDDHAFDDPVWVEGELEASLRTKSRIMVEVSQGDERFFEMGAIFVPLPPLPADAPRTVVLRGGGKFEIKVPWVANASGPHWLRARWFDFDGPVEPAEGQLPFMPIPDQGPGLVGTGPYPIRGTVYTDQPFEVPNP